MEQGGDPAAKKLKLAPSTRGRGAANVASKPGMGRGKPVTVAATASTPKSESSKESRQSQYLGRSMMGRAARSAAQRQAAVKKIDFADGSERATGTAAGAATVQAEDTYTGTFTKDCKYRLTPELNNGYNARLELYSYAVPTMMYGFGDDESPLQETVEVVEAALLQFLSSIATRATAVASSSLKAKPDERDIMFVVRKDPAKFARIKELLIMQQVIKDARSIEKGTMLAE